MPPMPLSWNLRQLKSWAEQSGIPFWGTPQAKNTRPYDGRSVCLRCNTCEICPTGARYSPDFTFTQLLEQKKIVLHDRTLIRRLTVGHDGKQITAAEGVSRSRNGEAVEYRAKTFVIASGYCWSPHLLLLSASSKYPAGLANRSGLVGKFMNGHGFVSAQIDLDAKIYPGMNEQHSLISRQFFRCRSDAPYVRHDLRIWESSAGREPRLKDAAGGFLFGDALLQEWRARTARGTARVRAYYDVHPAPESALLLNASVRNAWGDPMPAIRHMLDEKSRARVAETKLHIAQLARAGDGRVLGTTESQYLDHPAGGCRMGTDPASSVCDSFGRTHDHPNLFVVGAPTLPTGGCTNGTLTFVALTLRSATQIVA